MREREMSYKKMYINNTINLYLYLYLYILSIVMLWLCIWAFGFISQMLKRSKQEIRHQLEAVLPQVYILYFFRGVKYILFDSSFVYGFFLSSGRIITWSQPLSLSYRIWVPSKKKLILYFLALAILTSLVFLLVVLSETFER